MSIDLGTWGGFLAGVGGLLVGVAAVVSLVIAWRARREAAEAKAISQPAVLEGLRQQVAAIVESYEEGLRRHTLEREGLERALRNERERADGAELVALQAQAQSATYRIDLAEVKGQLADLTSRFEASIASHP